MEELLDLKQLANDLINEYQTLYTGEEIELPVEFKNRVTQIDNNSILYQRYSAVVSTKGVQKGVLYIFLPNQWFYIASFFTRYYNELQKYKRISTEIFSAERLKGLKNSSLTATEENALEKRYGVRIKDLIKNFVTDYDWWGGGKTIDRGDFFVSPILCYAKLVNATQSYVADLCAFLAKNEDLVKLLLNSVKQYNNTSSSESQNRIISNLPLQQIFYGAPGTGKYLPYLTALRTKPFMLLAGISGTGKSRIVRELAKACWKEGDEEYGKNNPKNFCMVQVKPNWHDSSELVGYVSRINGEKYVVGPFLHFLAKAINDPDTPYFLCLDEMNLAPVEQYFAEYLSVIESRKLNSDGSITTDPIIKPEDTQEYHDLIGKLFGDEERLKGTTITIPQNFFVVGTVNMDETTFSFSRKVLDRAMTIEMNEVDLHGGLTDEGSEIGYIGNSIIGNAAEGKDVYAGNKDLCDQVLTYLEKVNTVLEGTPFKIAYRTRNEFLLYAVNRQLLDKDSQLWQTLDEMTSMKILSRIEGDSERTKKVLEELKVLVEEEINKSIPEPEDGKEKLKSISDLKIKEMLEKLSSGYTSYWA